MSFLEALFSGAKAIFKGFASVAMQAVRTVLDEIDHSAFGRVGINLVTGMTQKYFSSARNLADEERDLADKFKRDGSRSEQDS